MPPLYPESNFFNDYALNNTDWTEAPTDEFGFRATALLFAMDSGSYFEYSFNGKDRAGKILITDRWAAFDRIDASKIYLRAPEAETKVRLWAWEFKK